MTSNIKIKKITNEILSIIIDEQKTYNSLSFKNLTKEDLLSVVYFSVSVLNWVKSKLHILFWLEKKSKVLAIITNKIKLYTVM